MKGEFATFLLAVQFLTRLPLPRDVGYTPARMAASVRYYPLVGLVIGGVVAAAFTISVHVWSSVVAVPLAPGLGLLLTGAFHEDGLADTFDGIGGAPDRERSLAIMRDSRIGTYGTCALVLALAVMAAALLSMPPPAAALALVSGHALSRLSAVLVIATGRYARDEGTGKPVSDGIGGTGLVVALATGLAALLVLAFGLSWRVAFGAIAGLVAGHAFIRLLCERRLGGYTGDTLGAVQQCSTVGLYLGVSACL
ncbi:MAG: adenosylcobinamide-GDP ribazoletransferase [Pseudomonadota bacterium]